MQASVIKMLEGKANDRNIIWIADVAGNIGKSRLATYLIKEKGAIELQGRIQDMAYLYEGEPIVVFDICRTQAENLKHLYSFAESLKNGRFVSTKYQSEQKVFDPPHVVFFANVHPEQGAWTDDRAVVLDSCNPDFNA